MRIDSIALKSQSGIKTLRRKIRGSHQRDLLHAFQGARVPDDLLHQGTGDSFAAGFGPHINAPNVALMMLFVVLTAEEPGCADQLAPFKRSDNEVAGRV